MTSRTEEFKELVQRNRKIFDYQTPNDELLRPAQQLTPFTSGAVKLLQNVNSMLKLMTEQKKEYVNMDRHFSMSASSMSDAERDQFEDQVLAFTKDCDNSIDQLKASIDTTPPLNTDVRAHRHGVVLHLYEQLSTLTEAMNVLKRIKTRHVQVMLQRTKADRVSAPQLPSPVVHESAIPELDPQEEAVLQLENQRLVETLEEEMGDLRTCEEKLAEISELMSRFSEKVVEQSKQIETIYETSVTSTERVRNANRELRKAEEGNSSRYITAIFIIIAAFMLLFLDWIQ